MLSPLALAIFRSADSAAVESFLIKYSKTHLNASELCSVYNCSKYGSHKAVNHQFEETIEVPSFQRPVLLFHSVLTAAQCI